MDTHIGINPDHRQNVANLLNKLLADEVVLYLKTRNYHWNVEGPSFFQLHLFLEKQYEELDEIMDITAERVRQLGHYALGTLSAFQKETRLLEGEDARNGHQMLQNLLSDHEAIIRQLRIEIPQTGDIEHDLGTADFLTAVMEKHEAMAWMIRAHLK